MIDNHIRKISFHAIGEGRIFSPSFVRSDSL